MNLIEMLLGSMTSDSSVDALAKKTGGSNKQMYALIIAAIPILIKFLTKNAKKEDGASSLLSALGQHTKKTSAAAQIEDADEEDGVKILAHILGDNQGKIVKDLSMSTGLFRQLAGLTPRAMQAIASRVVTDGARV